MRATILNSHTEAVVKVWGPSGTSETITFEDLLSDKQVLDTSTIPRITIMSILFSGTAEGEFKISRGGVPIISADGGTTSPVDFTASGFPPDNVESDKPIRVDIVEEGISVWVRLRKASGYASTVELHKYSIYDDPNIIGASTTLSGSPDYQP
jgi:hypothetical protein